MVTCSALNPIVGTLGIVFYSARETRERNLGECLSLQHCHRLRRITGSLGSAPTDKEDKSCLEREKDTKQNSPFTITAEEMGKHNIKLAHLSSKVEWSPAQSNP